MFNAVRSSRRRLVLDPSARSCMDAQQPAVFHRGLRGHIRRAPPDRRYKARRRSTSRASSPRACVPPPPPPCDGRSAWPASCPGVLTFLVLEARHQGGRRFIQRPPYIAVTRFADPPLHIDRRAGLPAPRREAKIRRHATRAAEPGWDRRSRS